MTDRKELADRLDGWASLFSFQHRDDLRAAASIIRGDDWRPVSEAPQTPGTYIDVRSVTTYRWLAYKPDGARQMKKAGRWQVAEEYGGWSNADLPEVAEFIVRHTRQPPPSDAGGER